MANNRWRPPRNYSISYKLFKDHHTHLNDMYWAHVPASLTIKKTVKTKKETFQKPLDFFVNKDENDRRVADSWEKWEKGYSDFLSLTRINLLLDINSYFEVYLKSIICLAMESRPDVLINRPSIIDGLNLLKNRQDYHFKNIRSYMFKNQLEGMIQGDWNNRANVFEKTFGSVPEVLIRNLDQLNNVRKLRNNVGHYFGRDPLKYDGKIISAPENLISISEKQLMDTLNLMEKISSAIDKFLLFNFIGCYELVLFFVQNFDLPRNDSKSLVKPKAEILRQFLGKDGYHPIKIDYSVDVLINYINL